MKKLCLVLIIVVASLTSCMEPEESNTPRDLRVSKGDAVGCILVEYDKLSEDQDIRIERREKGTEQWELITGTQASYLYDVHGYYGWGGPNLPIPPGKVFEYRVQNCCSDNDPYSEVVEGWSYEILPVTEFDVEMNDNNNVLRWEIINRTNFINPSTIFYDIYRSTDSLGTYEKVGRGYEDHTRFEDYVGDDGLAGQKVYYRIDVYYEFNTPRDVDGGHDFRTASVEGSIIPSGAGSSGDNPEVSYTASPLGQVHSSATGGIVDVKMQNVDGTLYVGLIGDASLAGTPKLYQYSGSSWQNVWTTLPQDLEYIDIEYALTSTHSYVAGIQDSVSVYEWDGSAWSSNLTPDNLGQVDSPSDVSIASLSDELYIAIKQHPDYNLEVMKWDGTNWNNIGGDTSGIIESGSVFDIELTNINGTLYLHYLVDDVLHIKHLEGTAWITDLAWQQEWLADIKLVKTGSELYFSSGSASTDFDGGVYRVDNTSAVTNLIPDEHETWFTLGAFDLTVDSDGNLIVASMKVEYADESQTSLVMYPHLNLYDGSEWKTISADFTGGIEPVALSTIGTDIYYLYGEAATENGAGDPTSLQSMKLVK